MLKTRSIISIIFLTILLVVALHLAIKFEDRGEILYLVILCASIVFLPVVIAFVLFAIRKRLLHPAFWCSSTLLIIALLFISTILKTTDSKFEKTYMAVDSYYYWKTGFFTPYKIIANKYPDKGTIITLYRSGSKKLRNYYISKVEVDSSGAVVKELYNERVIDAKSEVHSEFGELMDHWKIIKQANDEYR